MKNNTKKKLLFTSITEYKYLEYYLEKMASQGWMLCELKKSVMVFERTASMDLDFNVSLFYNITPFDYPDDENSNDYRTLCEESGWTFCASNAVYQIFWKEKKQYAVPIHTDSKEEYSIIKSTFLKTDLINMIMIPLVACSGMLQFAHFDYTDLFKNISLFSSISPILLILIWMSIFIPQISWFVKNKRNAKEGKALTFSDFKTRKAYRIVNWTLLAIYFMLALFSFSGSFNSGVSIFVFIFLLAIPSVISILCLKKFKTKKRTRRQNIIFFTVAIAITTLVVTSSIPLIIFTRMKFDSKDAMPSSIAMLELSDFGTTDEPESTRTREKSSILVPSYIEYYETLGRKPLDGEIYSVKTTYIECANESISNFVFEGYVQKEHERMEQRISEYPEYGEQEKAIEEKRHISIVPCDLWKIERGYYLDSNKSEIILQNGSTIYVLDGNIDFSELKNIKICRDKLLF